VYGGFFDLNGNGELTGQAYLQDFGVVIGPIGISNTNAIGQVYAGIQQWTQEKFKLAATPVVAETWDGRLNDIGGFHVQPADAIAAIEAARTGPVAEGNVGGGTGMVCFGFKGGIGTASRWSAWAISCRRLSRSNSESPPGSSRSGGIKIVGWKKPITTGR
jgi:L-aminopeptidase/D-esterase-like protein